MLVESFMGMMASSPLPHPIPSLHVLRCERYFFKIKSSPGGRKWYQIPNSCKRKADYIEVIVNEKKKKQKALWLQSCPNILQNFYCFQ